MNGRRPKTLGGLIAWRFTVLLILIWFFLYSPLWLRRFVLFGGARFNTDQDARTLVRPLDGVAGSATERRSR